MSTTAKNIKVRTLGGGLLQYEAIPDPDVVEAEQFTKLIDFGGIGDVKIKTVRTIVEDKDGTPQQRVVADVSEEDVTIEVELSEQSAVERIARLGCGEEESDALSDDKNETEYKTLTGTAYEALLGRDAESIVVTSQDATPVTYVLDTDYEVGTKEGSTAIRRIDRGAGLGIADGEQVKVTYTWDKPAGTKFSFGGSNALTYYRMRHVKKTRNNSRIITKFWIVTPGGTDEQGFLKTAYGKTTATFRAMADSSKAEGKQYYETVYETT